MPSMFKATSDKLKAEVSLYIYIKEERAFILIREPIVSKLVFLVVVTQIVDILRESLSCELMDVPYPYDEISRSECEIKGYRTIAFIEIDKIPSKNIQLYSNTLVSHKEKAAYSLDPRINLRHRYKTNSIEHIGSLAVLIKQPKALLYKEDRFYNIFSPDTSLFYNSCTIEHFLSMVELIQVDTRPTTSYMFSFILVAKLKVLELKDNLFRNTELIIGHRQEHSERYFVIDNNLKPLFDGYEYEYSYQEDAPLTIDKKRFIIEKMSTNHSYTFSYIPFEDKEYYNLELINPEEPDEKNHIYKPDDSFKSRRNSLSYQYR